MSFDMCVTGEIDQFITTRKRTWMKELNKHSDQVVGGIETRGYAKSKNTFVLFTRNKGKVAWFKHIGLLKRVQYTTETYMNYDRSLTTQNLYRMELKRLTVPMAELDHDKLKDENLEKAIRKEYWQFVDDKLFQAWYEYKYFQEKSYPNTAKRKRVIRKMSKMYQWTYIQPLLTFLHKYPHVSFSCDVHSGNYGYDKQGNVYLFDTFMFEGF